MQQTIEERLGVLRDEVKAGQEKLADLDNQRNSVRDALLRISGAIQVLEEIMEPAANGDHSFTSPSEEFVSRDDRKSLNSDT